MPDTFVVRIKIGHDSKLPVAGKIGQDSRMSKPSRLVIKIINS